MPAKCRQNGDEGRPVVGYIDGSEFARDAVPRRAGRGRCGTVLICLPFDAGRGRWVPMGGLVKGVLEMAPDTKRRRSWPCGAGFAVLRASRQRRRTVGDQHFDRGAGADYEFGLGSVDSGDIGHLWVDFDHLQEMVTNFWATSTNFGRIRPLLGRLRSMADTSTQFVLSYLLQRPARIAIPVPAVSRSAGMQPNAFVTGFGPSRDQPPMKEARGASSSSRVAVGRRGVL